MRIFFLCPEVPATPSMPGAPRIYCLARELASRHRLMLACFDTDPARRAAFLSQSEARELFDQVVFFPPPPAGADSSLSRLKHSLRRRPYFATDLRQPGFAAQTVKLVAEQIERFAPDVVFADRVEMVQYLQPQGDKFKIVDLCDCVSSLVGQQAAIEKSPLTKIRLHREARAIAEWEKRACREFDAALVVSEEDRLALQRAGADADKLLVVPLGVDIEYFSPAADCSPAAGDITAPRLLFTGVMSYGPNADAAHYFVEEILPLITRRLPQTTLCLAGASPPPSLVRLAERSGVSVTGSVEDIRRYIFSADIFVCPLRIGTGVKNKILSAFAAGLPVVATRHSLAGIAAVPGEHLLAAGTPEEFADQVFRLCGDEELRRTLIANGRQLVAERYSWSAVARGLFELLSRFEREKLT